jgi:SAM-dependent methyltransferase
MTGPDRQFWQNRFDSGTTPWDRGEPSPQLAAWLASGELDAASLGGTIAVPGCGNGYEVLALARAGFEVVGIDYTDAACVSARQRLDEAGLADAHIVQADVLEWQPAHPLAAVYEQTCLCALHPDHWVRYARALHGWLRPGGRLFVLAMQHLKPGAAEGFVEGPPFHTDIHALRALFDGAQWDWPKPPYARVPHPIIGAELALVLTRR